MNTELNKQVSVWRGNNTPPTDYHLWIKENGDILIKILGNWEIVANVTTLGDISTLKEDLNATKTDLGELKLNVEGLEILEIEAETSNTLKSYSLVYNGESKGIINIPKDRFLKNVLYDLDTKKLIFTFIISDGTETTLEISVADLVDVYKAGNNVTIKDNTISVDFSPITEVLNTTIKRVWQLEGGKEKEFTGDIMMELDEFLLRQGNYAALCVTVDKSKFDEDAPSSTILSAWSSLDTNHIFTIGLNADLNITLSLGDNDYRLFFDDNKPINIIIYQKHIKNNNLDSKEYALEVYNAIDTVVYHNLKTNTLNHIICYNSVYTKFSLVPFASNNNYAIEYVDGRIERFNKTDDIRIGGTVDASAHNSNIGFIQEEWYGTRFFKGGSLNVNGTLKARDTAVKSLDVSGPLHVNGQIYATQSIHTYNVLEAGETTINGTLHVEGHDIKTQSLYPAKTGSSTLKDASKGKVKGNYKVSAGNLGKGAHNYDKLFVKNIMWSDQTDITNADTSLNGEGTIQVWSKEGFDKSPTLWMQSKSEESATCGVWNNGSGITFEKRDGDQKAYSVTIDENGNLKDNVVTTPFVWGNGTNYDSTNKIPSSFVEDMIMKVDKGYVDAMLHNYLPLTGGTLDGDVVVSGSVQNVSMSTTISPNHVTTEWQGGIASGNVSTEYGYNSITHKNSGTTLDPTSIDCTYKFPSSSGTLALTELIPTKLSELSDDVVKGKYLPLGGGIITGDLSTNAHLYVNSNMYVAGSTAQFHSPNVAQVMILCDNAASKAAILFRGKKDVYGCIGFDAADKGKQLTRCSDSTSSTWYEILDTSTTGISGQTIKINNTSLTVPTKLSELTNDIAEACTTDEINALFE